MRHEDTAAVRGFFADWAVYQAAVRGNSLRHREAAAAMRAAITARGTGAGRVLDLGCGDAGMASLVLADLSSHSYHGIDLTPQALALAERTAAAWAFPHAFQVGDLRTVLAHLSETVDTVIVSLAMHHLPTSDKPEFFRLVRERLGPAGLLLMYEPASLPGELRADYCDRAAHAFRLHFTEVSPPDVEAIIDHVRSADYPEPPGDYARMALDAGFRSVRVGYEDPDRLWAMIAIGVD